MLTGASQLLLNQFGCFFLYFRALFVMGYPFLLPYQAIVCFPKMRVFIKMGNLNPTYFFINSKRPNASCVTVIYGKGILKTIPTNSAYGDDGDDITSSWPI